LSLNGTQGSYKIKGIYAPFTSPDRRIMEVDGDESKFFFYGSRGFFEANRNNGMDVEELFLRYDPHGKGVCAEIPFGEIGLAGSRLDILRYMVDEAHGSIGENLIAGLREVPDIGRLKLPAWFKSMGEAAGSIKSSKHKERKSQRLQVRKPKLFFKPMTGRSRTG
jgi:hypothetical protein